MAISLTASLIETEGHNRTRAGRPEGDFDPRSQLTGLLTK